MKQYHEINFVRSVLILLVILVHIVYFGELYPTVKAGILGFMMPSFLVVTGYLVNIEKTFKEFSLYLFRIFVPYLIMVVGFSVLSAFLPVRDGIAEITVSVLLEKRVRVVDWPLLVSLCHDGMWHLLLSELQNSADREARRRAVDSVRWSFVSRFLSGATHDGEDCDVLFCRCCLATVETGVQFGLFPYGFGRFLPLCAALSYQ